MKVFQDFFYKIKTKGPGGKIVEHTKPKLFICDFLAKHNMTKDGNKEGRIKRLVQHYVQYPDLIDQEIINYLLDDYVGKEANLIKEKYLSAVCSNQLLQQETTLLDGANTRHQTEFGMKFMELTFYAHKLCIFPTATNLVLLGKEYSTNLVEMALNSMGPLNLLPYTTTNVTSGDPTRRKTNTCQLQLLLILITDDSLCKELMSSKTTPSCAAMDQGAIGDKADFWKKACDKFKDDYYIVPDFPVVNFPNVFIDEKTNEEYDEKSGIHPGSLQWIAGLGIKTQAIHLQPTRRISTSRECIPLILRVA
jgi:hypothetical protein